MTSLSSEENVCDIRLLCNDADRMRYGCGRCGELAVNTKSLSCDQHPQEITLYCEQCVILIQNENQCPVNKHSNPIFIDSKISREEIHTKLEFMCPYSVFVEDTIKRDDSSGEDEKHQHFAGCQWKGSLNALKNHVKTCQFKQKTDNFINKSINELNNEINILKQTIDSLQNIQTHNASKNKETFNELQQKAEAVGNITNEMRELRRDTDTLRQRVDSATDYVQSKGICTSGMYLSIICCVLLSIIGGGIYKNRNKILLLTYDDANNVYQQTFKEMMKNMVQNETIESMKDFKYKMEEMESDLTEKIDALKENKEVIDDNPWDGDVISNITTICKCITYYLMKLFGEVIVIWCLVVMMKKDSTQNDVLYGRLCSVLSHLIIQIFYFYPSNWSDWNVMYIVIGLNCVASLVPRQGELARVRNRVAIHALIGLTSLNVIYWRVWCNDDRVGNVVVLPFYLFLLCVTVFDGPGLKDKKNVWFCVHIVISFLIVIGLLFQ